METRDITVIYDQPSVLGYVSRDPVESVRHTNLAADGPEGGKALISSGAKQHKGVEGLTMAELSAKWSDVVEALDGEGVKVTNPEHAMEGALCLRYAELHSMGYARWCLHQRNDCANAAVHRCYRSHCVNPAVGNLVLKVVLDRGFINSSSSVSINRVLSNCAGTHISNPPWTSVSLCRVPCAFFRLSRILFLYSVASMAENTRALSFGMRRMSSLT